MLESHNHNPKSLKLLMFQNWNLTICYANRHCEMISILTFSSTLPIRKTTESMTSKRLPYFWLTPPASFTLIGRVCHSSESFAKNEQRLLFSPTNLSKIILFLGSILFFCFFYLFLFCLVFGFSLFSPPSHHQPCWQKKIHFKKYSNSSFTSIVMAIKMSNSGN